MVSSVRKIVIGSVAASSAMSGVVAQNRAGCNIRSVATTAVVIQPAVAEAWVNIGGFACGNPEDGTDVTEIDTQIEMVAMAAAESVAEITADCAVQGNGRINTEGSAIADARAEAYGTAITNVFVENDACPGCTAVVDALVRTSQVLIAEATASAWIQLSLVGTGNEDEVVTGSVNVAAEAIAVAVAEVLAGVTGTVRASAQQGCEIDIDPVAQVGDFFATCNLIATGANRNIETDAIVEIALEAQAFACGDGDAQVDQTALAQATARALADAVAQTEVTCESNGGGDSSACGFARADVEVIARAQAFAFVEIFASAEVCGCDTEQHVEAEAFENIWAEAAASAYAEACIEGAGTDFAQDFERNVMERMEVATAQAIVSAISSATEAGEMCNLNLRICAATSKCAERNAICRGPGVDGIIPCCVSDQQCVRRTETESRCRTMNTTLPSFFLGGPTEFPVCAPEIDM